LADDVKTDPCKIVPGDLLGYFKRIFRKMPPERQRQFWGLAALILVLAMAETLAVGLISFYAATISDPASVLKFGAIDTFEKLLGDGFAFSGKSLIGWLSVAVIIAVVFKNALRGVFVYAVSRFSASLEAFFGHRLLETFLLKPYAWHLDQNSADLVQIVNWRTFVGRHFVTPSLNILSETCVLLVLLCSLLVIEPVVFLLFVVVQGGAIYVLYCQLKRKLDYSASRCKEKDRNINREVTKSIHGFKDVKITGTSQYFIDRFDTQATPYAKYFGRQQFWREAPLLTLESVGFVLVCGAILFMLYVLRYSPLAITGTTALLAVTAWRTLPALNRVVAALTTIRTALPYVSSLLPFLEEKVPPQVESNDEASEKSLEFKETIEFRDVNFAYSGAEGRNVFDRFNLTIHRGQTVGIMGASGCGKSTMIDLLVGLLSPQHGNILIDGKPLAPEKSSSWVRNIGYVPQFPYIFDGTIAENVAFGMAQDQIDNERVLESCRQAAIDFMDQLPEGIHTMIGERGVRLSGGQRQRVAIARALYRQPNLLIFDEATSSLDEENDRRIRSLIGELRGQRTLFVVAHRESTLEMCDFVYSFEEDGQLSVVYEQEV
jgi:ABC-type multidrug transport system fused ATPase/permease subunit